MNMSIKPLLGRVHEHLVAVAGVVGLVVGGLAWLDARYMHAEDVVMQNLMSQSTRYAEI